MARGILVPWPGVEPRTLAVRAESEPQDLQGILFFFLFYFIFKLYNIVLVLPNIEMNPPQVYMQNSWKI